MPGLPSELVDRLGEHECAQAKERERAAQLWEEGGWAFTASTGHPLNPNTDYHDWKQLLKDADVRDSRLHDAQHIAPQCL